MQAERRSEQVKAEIERLFGFFPNFFRPVLEWIEAYPGVSSQADERAVKLLAALVRDEPRLADFFSRYPEIVRGELQSCEERLSAELADLKRIEEALRVSEERYRTLVESAPEAILVVDVSTGRFVDANENSVRLFGLERSELFKLGPIDISQPIAPNGRPASELASEKIREALDGGTPVFEWMHRNSAGEDIHCEVRLMRLPGAERNLIRGSITDITERKRAEGKLRESEEQVRLILDSIAEGIFGCDSEGTCLFSNRAAARLLGYDDPAELLGRNMHALEHHTRADGTPYPIEECPIYRGFQKGEGVHRDDEVYWRKDGTGFPVEFWSHPIVRDGKTIGAVVTFVDITERKCADEALRQYVERLKIMREMDRSILAAQSAEEIARVAVRRLRELIPSERVTVVLAGPAPGESTVLAADVDSGRSIEAGKRLPIEPYGDLANLIAEKLQRGETYLLDVLSVPDPPPAIRELRTTGRRYYFIVPLLAHGELMGSLSLGTDHLNALTDEHLEIAREVADGLAIAVQQARLREQISQHAAELEQRVAERTEELEAFSYSVSHDLRTPLLTIDGFSRMLLEDYSDFLDAEGQRLLKTICGNSQNMGRLIDDLLAFSRLGRQEMRPSVINMSELASAVCAELQATAPERKLQFDLRPLPLAHGDQAMIRQVWVNLLSNAIKFTGPRDVAVIEVGAEVEETHNVYYVKDNGVGFEMKYADKLFGVFERLHGDNEFAGTGVGLAFVQRIIHRHGGRVSAEGKVDEGAIVYFTLPRKGRKSW